MLKFYARFEINDESGDALTDHDMTQLHYSKIISLQVRVNFMVDTNVIAYRYSYVLKLTSPYIGYGVIAD